jgi:hypothetical protein
MASLFVFLLAILAQLSSLFEAGAAAIRVASPPVLY